MKTLTKAILASSITLALTGISYAEETKSTENNKINEVKEYTYNDIDRTLTLGDALDTREMCKESSWGFKVDKRKRNIVEYVCDLTGYKEHMDQFSDEVIKLEKLKESYTGELAAKEKAEMFIAFMESMDKQGVIATFAEVKKKTPSITKMSLFVLGQTYDGALEAGVPEKLINKFMKASKTYNDALKDEELAALTDDLTNASALDEMTNKTKYNRKLFNTVMEKLNEIRSKEYANIDALKEKIDFIERQQAKSKAVKKDAPETKLTQTVGFTMIKGRPMVVYCDFNFYDNAAKAKPKAVENITSYSVCLKESYKSEYDKFYTDIFTKLQVK